MKRKRPLLLTITFFAGIPLSSAATPPTSTLAVSSRPITIAPQFATVHTLLAQNQGASLGAPITNDINSTLASGPRGISHFQLFAEPAGIQNSAEIHTNGCIYVAYTPPKGPTWYDTYAANEADKTRHNAIPAGASGNTRFADTGLKERNVNPSNWLPPKQAFRNGRGPAPRWFTICGAVNDVQALQRQIHHATGPLLQQAGAFCFWDVYHDKDNSIHHFIEARGSNLPEWQTILPRDNWESAPFHANLGQKTYFHDRPLNAVVGGMQNHYVSWQELISLAQTNPTRVTDIVHWNGHPSRADLGASHPTPWISSNIEGVVPNSFLSGEDYAGSHVPAPNNWWLGQPPPNPNWTHNEVHYSKDENCRSVLHGDLFGITNHLCDDWIAYVHPDPEYQFMLSAKQRVPASHHFKGDNKIGLGNFGAEHQGSLESEGEQWFFPAGYRPNPGDRIVLVGRWIIDCGHDEYHAELHPMESYVTSHSQVMTGADGGTKTTSTVVTTPAWWGETLNYDIWPPARPSATASLHWSQERCCHNTGGSGLSRNVRISAQTEPADNPNHVHLTIVSTTPRKALKTRGLNDVYPDIRTARLLATRFHLWWRSSSTPVIANPPR